MTYKYRPGSSMINEYSDFTIEKGKLKYTGSTALGAKDRISYLLSGIEGKLLSKKKCYKDYCMSLGWLDKLGCFS